MKINLSLLVFFALLVPQFNHSACDESTPEKQALIHAVIVRLAQEYIDVIPAREPICELNKQAFHDFLQQRVMNSENLNREELGFLSTFSNRSKSMEIQEWHMLVNRNPNLRVDHYYRLKTSYAWQCRVGIEFNCLLKHWDTIYPEEAKKMLKPVDAGEIISIVRAKYPKKDDGSEHDTIVQWHLEASHCFAQEVLRLCFPETNN